MKKTKKTREKESKIEKTSKHDGEMKLPGKDKHKKLPEQRDFSKPR